MYAAAGHIVEQLSGQSWEEYVRIKFFVPLGMSRSIFSAEDMQKQPDFLTAYYEKRDTSIQIPHVPFQHEVTLRLCRNFRFQIAQLSLSYNSIEIMESFENKS